jgi:hypothetical protein
MRALGAMAIDIADMMGRAEYCLRRAQAASDHAMKVNWQYAAEAWETAAYRIGNAISLIRRWEAERDPSEPPAAAVSAPIVAAPICPKCKTKMRLTGIEPHGHYVNLYQRLFACRCGARESRVVTRST